MGVRGARRSPQRASEAPGGYRTLCVSGTPDRRCQFQSHPRMPRDRVSRRRKNSILCLPLPGTCPRTVGRTWRCIPDNGCIGSNDAARTASRWMRKIFHDPSGTSQARRFCFMNRPGFHIRIGHESVAPRRYATAVTVPRGATVVHRVPPCTCSSTQASYDPPRCPGARGGSHPRTTPVLLAPGYNHSGSPTSRACVLHQPTEEIPPLFAEQRRRTLHRLPVRVSSRIRVRVVDLQAGHTTPAS